MARNLAYFLVFAACRHAASLCRLPVYGLLCIVVISGRADGSTIQGKKIIKLFGWDKPTTASLRVDIRRMEATGLDGTGVNLMPDPPLTAEEYGGHGNYMWFSTRHFRDEEYAKAVEDLRQTNFQRFTELFSLMAMRGPDLLSDWFDDESWQTVVHNARVHARACRKGGLRGIMVDVETSALLRYSPHHRESHAFEVYCRRVRECGRQWMAAMVQQYPGITVMVTHGYFCAAGQMHGQGIPLEYADYAILPPSN